MDKKEYERIKGLRKKVKDGTATFAERNIINMEDKKVKKLKKVSTKIKK